MASIYRNLTEVLAEVREQNKNPQTSRPLQLEGGWSEIARAMEGWLHGIFLVAGQTNHGKSSTAVNLTREILLGNYDHVYVMDFTLDDTLRRRIAIYVASMVGVQINDVLMEHRVTDPQILHAIDEGYRALSTWQESFMVYDTAEISRLTENTLVTVSVDRVVRMVEHQANLMRRQNDRRKLLVIIDAINDLCADRRFESDLQEQEYIVQQLVSLATSTDTLLLCTSHSRKNTNWRNPNLDDVFGGSALKYAAQVVTFVYNDVVGRSQPEQSPMIVPEDPPPYYAGAPHIRRHVPVLVWHWRKNKTSPFVGRLYLKLVQWSNRIDILTGPIRDAYDRKFEDIL